MLEKHLIQPTFVYSACGPFTKKRKKECTIFLLLYLSKQEFKDLPKRTPSDKTLLDKPFNIAKNSVIRADLCEWFINFLIKKTSGCSVKNENMSNHELAEESHKLVIRELVKRKVSSSFTDKIWGSNLADKQSLSKFN